MLLLSLRTFSLLMQHNPNVGQARWGVYLAFMVGLTQFIVVMGDTRIGRVTTSPDPDGSPALTRALDCCPGCGTRAAAGDNFCQQCGTVVTAGA